MNDGGDIWYVGYGTNLSTSGVNHYLSQKLVDRREYLRDEAEPNKFPAARWVTLCHQLYFAGASKTWGGGVAFVDVAPHDGHLTMGRAYPMDMAAFATLIIKENGASPEFRIPDLSSLACGEHLVLALDEDPEGYRGKYNAVLRLRDIEGRRAYTLTTARTLPLAKPAPGYLECIRVALGHLLQPHQVFDYLAAAQIYDPHRGR